MESIIGILTTANSLSPLAVIALLAVIIFLLVRGKQEVSSQVSTISDNHLHDISSQLAQISETLQRLEVSVSENFAYLKARLNNK